MTSGHMKYILFLVMEVFDILFTKQLIGIKGYLSHLFCVI